MLDSLNLRPMERRLVIAVAVVVFFVLNALFVWPHFKDWNKVRDEHKKAQETLRNYKIEIAKNAEYKAEKEKLEGQGQTLLPVEMTVQLRNTIQNQATQSGIVPSGITELPKAATTKEDQLFDEMAIRMGFSNAKDEELVDFLYNISAGKSMIRVKDLNVRPDASAMRLQGEITLVASYQKKGSSKVAPKPASGTKASSEKKPAGKAAKPDSSNVERSRASDKP